MDCQGLWKLLSVGKLGYGGATPIICDQGLGRIHICRGVIGKHASLRVTGSFKISHKPHLTCSLLTIGSPLFIKLIRVYITIYNI